MAFLDELRVGRGGEGSKNSEKINKPERKKKNAEILEGKYARKKGDACKKSPGDDGER